MRSISDRRLGNLISILDRLEKEKEQKKTEERSKEHFQLTLDKLWPLKSNEQQN